MVKYFLGQSVLRSSWDQVFAAFWQRYPNPYSKHVLTEDIVHREVTPDQKLLSRRLLTKTNRMPRWAERLFPANVAHSVYILEDSIVDPQNQTMTTYPQGPYILFTFQNSLHDSALTSPSAHWLSPPGCPSCT